MKNLNKRVGEITRRIREQHGLTQDELAEASGIHEKYIGQIERGLHGITLEYLDKLSKGLNVHVADLVKIIFLLETSEVRKDKDWLVENINALLQKQSVENLKSLHHILLQLPAAAPEDENNGTANKKKDKNKK